MKTSLLSGRNFEGLYNKKENQGYSLSSPCFVLLIKYLYDMKHLTKEQRYQIKSYLDCKKTKSFIAEALQVSKSTISREIKRNSTKRGKYNPAYANELAEERKERFRYNRKFTDSIRKLVDKYLIEEQWSPEQIVGYCRNNGIKMVSVERIYQYIRKDKALGGTLYKHLRHKLKHCKRNINSSKIRIKDRISIEQRPEKANNREEFGHFEIDLVVGKDNKGAILTITERMTRHFICRYLPHGKKAKYVSQSVILELLPFKKYVRSITVDNGMEFADHKTIAEKLDTTVYFTHPYSAWEKGQIEYANKLLRQYIPKKTIINEKTTQNLSQIQAKINRRPRKKLDFQKPFKLFYKFVNNNVAFDS